MKTRASENSGLHDYNSLLLKTLKINKNRRDKRKILDLLTTYFKEIFLHINI